MDVDPSFGSSRLRYFRPPLFFTTFVEVFRAPFGRHVREHVYFAHLDLYILSVAYLVHLDMLTLFVVYYHDYFLACYSSCLSHFLLRLFVDLDDIYLLYMIALLLHDACVACLCGTHLSPYLQFRKLDRPCFPWSHIWYKTCWFFFFDQVND